MRKIFFVFSLTMAGLLVIAGTANAFIPLDPNFFHIVYCNNIKNKTEVKLENIKDKRAKHINLYDSVVSRLEALIDRANGDGFNTTQLRTDLVTLKDEIGDFKDHSQDAIDTLNELKDKACDNTSAQNKALIVEAKKELKKAREDIQDIRSFFKNTIKPDIRQLENQM